MRIGVRLGPVWLSTSTRSRETSRRRRSSQPSWHAKGHATTPDGREVDFRCHHNHRSQSAALDCASTTRKQIERGQNLHLVTRVRSTPASREAARQRALKQEAERQAKAAQRAQAAQQRAQRREAAAQQRAQQREALALQRQQQAAEQHARRTETARQRAERREESAHQRPGQWTQIHQRNDEQWDRVHHSRARRSHPRRSRSWPATGLMIAGAVALLGVILAGIASNNPHSALATTAGGLITLGILAALVCATAALWRRLRKGKRDEPRQPIPGNQNALAPYRPPPFTYPTGYTPGPYRGQTTAERPPTPHRPPVRALCLPGSRNPPAKVPASLKVRRASRAWPLSWPSPPDYQLGNWLVMPCRPQYLQFRDYLRCP